MGNYLGKQSRSLRRHERRPSYTHSAAPVLGPRAATPGVAANPGPSVDDRRVESRLPVWLRGVFIIAVHHAFVLGLGARHGGIVELSEDSCGCVTVSARFTYLLT